jgi:hypothetical protein
MAPIRRVLMDAALAASICPLAMTPDELIAEGLAVTTVTGGSVFSFVAGSLPPEQAASERMPVMSAPERSIFLCRICFVLFS